MHWLYYTMIFGLLPIVIRCIVSLSVLDERIPLFSLADFAFFGIMLNIAAITNVTNLKKTIPHVIVFVVSIAIVHIAFLTTLYSIALFPEVKHSIVLVIAGIVLASSFLFLYATTDMNLLLSLQMASEMADIKDTLHPLKQAYMEQTIDLTLQGIKPQEGDWEKYLDALGHEEDPVTKEIRRKTYPKADVS